MVSQIFDQWVSYLYKEHYALSRAALLPRVSETKTSVLLDANLS